MTEDDRIAAAKIALREFDRELARVGVSLGYDGTDEEGNSFFALILDENGPSIQ